MSKARLDRLLLARMLVPSRTIAQKLIEQQKVSIFENGQWRLAIRAAEKISECAEIKIADSDELRFVSRAGLKLDAAIQKHSIELAGKLALDIGQSTGGFTDCLLQAGAAGVIGVDVGHDQLHPRLKQNPKVRLIEGCNARKLSENTYISSRKAEISFAVMDVSFISQTLILPELSRVLFSGSELVSLVKPQFEVGKHNVGKGGIVRDRALYKDVEILITNKLQETGFKVLDYFASPIDGGDGNREFLVYAEKE